LSESKGGKIEAYKITSKIKSQNGGERTRASWITDADINVKEQRSFGVRQRSGLLWDRAYGGPETGVGSPFCKV
jgi:hypothetical protein